jgi:hypothetical protein
VCRLPRQHRNDDHRPRRVGTPRGLNAKSTPKGPQCEGGSLPGFPADLVPATTAVRAEEPAHQPDLALLGCWLCACGPGCPPCWRCWPGAAADPRDDHQAGVDEPCQRCDYDEALEPVAVTTGPVTVRNRAEL